MRFPPHILVNIFKHLPVELLDELNELEKKIDPDSKFIESIIYNYKFIPHCLFKKYNHQKIKYLNSTCSERHLKVSNLTGVKIVNRLLRFNCEFQQHQKIKYLNVNIYWDWKSVHTLSLLSNLEYLIIIDVPELDKILKILSTLKHLKSLAFINCHLCPDFFKTLSECQNLRILKLNNIKSSSSYYHTDISYLSKLKLVELSMISIETLIFWYSVSNIARIVNLNKLTIHNAYTVSDLDTHWKKLINLRYLEISKYFTRNISPGVIIGLPHLRSINLIQGDGSKIGIAINLNERDKFKWP